MAVVAKPTFTLSSPETGTDYWVYVKEPAAPGPWTAVAVLDGDDMFKPAVEACAKAGVVPPLLIVGIGYGSTSRGHDPCYGLPSPDAASPF